MTLIVEVIKLYCINVNDLHSKCYPLGRTISSGGPVHTSLLTYSGALTYIYTYMHTYFITYIYFDSRVLACSLSDTLLS